LFSAALPGTSFGAAPGFFQAALSGSKFSAPALSGTFGRRRIRPGKLLSAG
jgi:hypothetical protein